MTKRLIGIDQADRSWLLNNTRKVDPAGVAYNVVTLIALIATVVILFAASSAVSAKEPMCYAADHEQAELVASPDMDEYLGKYGKGQLVELGDLQ